MKLTKISITGMHKVGQKSYDLNELSYFVGPNGAGKSTVLEAIQLALLGYIPGYAKTNESIMKHASGPVMAVVAELDSGISITRTWSRVGSSVTSKTDVSGYDGEFSDLLSDIELPIFNFDEFRSMTANKLKEWFISFLPSSCESIDLRDELIKEAETRSLPYEELISRTASWIEDYQKGHSSAIDVVKGLNAHLKEEQSYVKGQVAKLQGTIQSLVRYEGVDDLDEDELNQQILIQENLEKELVAYEAQKSMIDKMQRDFEAAKASLPAESFEVDTRVPEITNKISENEKKLDVLLSDYSDIQSSLSELQHKRALIPDANPICPYTSKKCETASKLTNEFVKQAKELDDAIQFKKEESLEYNPLVTDGIRREVQRLKDDLNKIRTQYDRLESIKSQIPESSKLVPPTSLSREDIAAELAQNRRLKEQIAANKQYEALVDKVTADKFNLENELEILKLWVKLTDANGLQSSMMNKPFEDLSENMSKYLSDMFNAPIEAKFNLVSKANSFSFGLSRDGQYIEFDYLSSGERCLFTLALILCILDRSGSQIRTIIIDDILDHLDSDNAEHLFKALQGVKDVQFILAGVKECKDKKICQSV